MMNDGYASARIYIPLLVFLPPGFVISKVVHERHAFSDDDDNVVTIAVNQAGE
jgi:hypothetical protein